MSAESGRCFRPYPHPPHVEVRFIAGGDPGPVPTSTHVCPGIEPEPFEATDLTPHIAELDAAARAAASVDQVIPSEMWDACVAPTWTRGDEITLATIEHDFRLDPWQMAFLARHFPEEAS